MRSLYLRIWLTVIVTLALFAGASGWLVQRHLDQEHARNQAALTERIAAWGDLIQRSLPPEGEFGSARGATLASLDLGWDADAVA